jgi:hypothetical protein
VVSCETGEILSALRGGEGGGPTSQTTSNGVSSYCEIEKILEELRNLWYSDVFNNFWRTPLIVCRLEGPSGTGNRRQGSDIGR